MDTDQVAPPPRPTPLRVLPGGGAPRRWVAPGGWRRALIGAALGVLAGLGLVCAIRRRP